VRVGGEGWPAPCGTLPPLLRATFQLTPGIGPWRERELWSAGVTRWEAFPPAGDAVSPKLDGRLREAIARAEDALCRPDAEALAAMLPRRERWRLYGAFADDAAFLDVETDAHQQVTAIGVLDRHGPRIFLQGRDLDDSPKPPAPGSSSSPTTASPSTRRCSSAPSLATGRRSRTSTCATSSAGSATPVA